MHYGTCEIETTCMACSRRHGLLIGFAIQTHRRAKAGMVSRMQNSRQPKWTSGPSKLMVCGIWKDGNSAVISGQIGSH